MVAPVRYLSRREQQQKLGILGYTEQDKVLEVIGRVGIGTTIFDADYNLDVRGNARINDLLISGPLNIQDLNVSGIATFSGFSDFNGDVDISGHTELDNLNVSGVSTFASNVDINSSVNISDLVIVGGGLSITGVSTFLSRLDIRSDVSVTGSTEVDEITVLGLSTFNAAVDINSTLQVSSTLDALGSVNITQNLDVNGHTELDNLNVSGVSTFASNIDANGDLDVDGHTELDNLNVSGVATFASNIDANSSVDISNDVVIGRNLSVSGISTFTGNIDANGNLDVDGQTDLDVLNVSELATFSGNIDANGDLDVDGHTELDNLNVSGVSTFASNIDANGDLDVDGHTELDNLNVSGVSTFLSKVNVISSVDISNDLDVSGVSTFTSDVNAKADVNITQNLDVDGHTELDNLNVSGVSTFASNIDANGDLDVDGHTELDNLNVSGVATFASNVNVQGELYGPAEFIIDPAAVGDNTGLVRIKGDLYVDGTEFIVNSSTIELADFKVGIATTVTTNLLLDGAGISIGSTEVEKSFTYNNTSNTLESSIGLGVTSGGDFKTGTDSVLNRTTLGPTVVNSSLTSVGTLNSLNVSGVSTFSSDIDANGGLDVDGHTELDTLNVSIAATISNLTLSNLGIAVTAILDEDDMISDRDDALATQQSIKAYVDSRPDPDLTFAGDVGIGTIDIDNETFTIAGTVNEIETVGIGNTLTIGLPGSIAITTSLTVASATTITGSGIIAGIITGTLDNDLTLNTAGIGLTGSATYNNSGTTTFTVTSNATATNSPVTIVSRDGSGNFSAGVITADLTGTATTATQLETARTFEITGDVVASPISFDGTGNVSLAATIQPNSVELGTDTFGNYVATIADSGDTDIVVNNSGTETAAITLGLTTTGVTTGSYGSITEIPTFTVDSRGRLTAAGTVSVGSALTVSGDSGSETIDLLTETLTISGGTNLTSSAAADTVTINLDDNISLTSVNATGVVTASGGFVGDLTGTATTATNLADAANITTGTISADRLTGTYNIDINGIASTATSLETPRTFEITGDVVASPISFDGTGNVSLAATIQPNSVELGTDTFGNYVATIADAGDTDVVVNNSGTETAAITLGLTTTGVTAGSYGSSSQIPTFTVDSRGRLTAAGTAIIGIGLTVSGDSGTETINFLTETLTISGGTNLTSSAAADTVTVNLDNNISLTGVNATGIVTASGGFVGDLTGTATTATQLETARTFQITGDVVASPISFDGTGNVSLAATIQPNSVELGADTFGDYVESISGTANQITVTGGTGEGSTPTVSIASNATLPGNVTIANDLQVNNNLNVTGNITIGGTTGYILVENFRVSDPDIILGFTTDGSGNDVSNDTTANHGGVAVASTEGNPLVSLNIAGIETLPTTYKKIMWFKAGSFAGLGTDAWLSNYAVGIGSTQFPTGTRLAAGSVQFTEYDLAVVRNINASGVITASNFVGSLTGTASTASFATTAFTLNGVIEQDLNVSYADNAGIATNIKGGVAGNLPYQSATDTTSFVTNGSSGQVLVFNGSVPVWNDISASGAISGITVKDEGVIVGTAGSVLTLDFVGANVEASASGGISTITLSDNIVGTSLSISGISTFSNDVSIGSSITLNAATGIVSAVAFYGSGENLSDVIASKIDGIDVKEEGSLVSDEVTSINFIGDYVTASVGSTTTAANITFTTPPYATSAGIATTATQLETARTFEITGDVVASPISFDGTGNVSLAATIQPNSVELGTDTFGNYVATIADSGDTDIVVNNSGTETAAITLGLTTTGITAGSYGSASQIPTFTVDSRGRLTAAGTSAVGTALTVSGDTGSETISLLSETLTISGGTNLTSSTASDTVTINLDPSISLTGINASGVVTASGGFVGDLTGTATTATNLADAANITTGTISADRLTGTYNISISGNAATATYADNAGVSTSVIGGIGSLTSLTVSGVSTFASNIDANGDLDVDGHTELDNLNVSGVSTFASSVDINASVDISADLVVNDSLNVTGLSTFGSDVDINASADVSGDVSIGGNLSVTGITTSSEFKTGTSGQAIGINTNTISGPETITIDPAGIGDNTGLVIIKGDLQVDGTETVINSTTVTVNDKNIQIADGALNDAAADGAGITVNSGDGDKTFQFVDANDSFQANISLDVTSGNVYKINGTEVLSATTLGSSVVNSSLTSVGTLGQLNVTGVVTASSFDGNATTASALQTARTIELSGDVSGSTTFDGSANVTISATIQPDSVALGNDTTGNYVATIADAGNTNITVNNSGTETAAVTLDLTNTTVSAGSYGSASQIPTFTVDSKGRLTAAGSTAVGIGLTVSGDSGSETINFLTETLTISGGTNLTSSAASDTVTINLDDYISLSGINATGVVTASSFDGNATTATALETARTFEITGDVLATAISFDGSNNVSLAATIQPNSVELGTDTFGNYVATIADSGDTDIVVNNSGTETAAITLGLTTTGVTAGSYGSASQIPTFTVDSRGRVTAIGVSNVQTGAGVSLSVAGDSGTESIDLGSETLTISGGTNLTSSAATDTVTINLDDYISLTGVNATGVVTASSFDGNATTASALQTARTITLTGDASGSTSFDGSSNVSIAVTVTAADVLEKIITVDGSGSNLDADLLDGIDSTSFLRSDANDTASGQITFTNSIVPSVGNNTSSGINWPANPGGGSGDQASIRYYITSGENTTLEIRNNNDSADIINLVAGSVNVGGNRILTTSDEGSGNGLDADTLDGQQGSYYRNASNINAGTIGDAYLPATISSDITGNSATATKLATARSISLGGDLSGSTTFDGSSNVTISATIQANSVSLGSDTTGNYVATIADAGNSNITVNNSGSETAAVTLDLTNTTVSAGSYGSATEVATFTVDSKGRLTAAGTATISTPSAVLNVAGNSGSESITLSTETLTISGGTNLTSSAASNTVTINLDNNISLTGINATGVITASTFVGDGSGLSGVGVTVFNDVTSNSNFYPVFTDSSTGAITTVGVSASKLTYNPSEGEITAVNFNSTSDANLKTNVKTVQDSLTIIDNLRGVSFDWKESGKASYGVIAQELEEVLPELVNQSDVKSVNYNGIIAVLIESIKELKSEIEELKKQ